MRSQTVEKVLKDGSWAGLSSVVSSDFIDPYRHFSWNTRAGANFTLEVHLSNHE